MNVEEKYFSNINSKERAIFEGAITMGALFHQFTGTPVNKVTCPSLEEAIKKSLELQPAIEKVDVKIYSKIKDVTAIIRIEYIEELNYPLMYVEDIIE